MSKLSLSARPSYQALSTRRQGTYTLSAVLFGLGGGLQIWLYESLAPVVFVLSLAMPVVLALMLRRGTSGQEINIFLRSLSTGLFAAGIASYYAIVLLDVFQLDSDASSFFELASQAGPARSIQDLRTITEGAGAVVLWSWFYNAANFLGFPREPYIGISINVLVVALATVVCARSARAIYGEDEYRFQRLVVFVTISGMLWLFAGIHIRDSVIFLAIAILGHFWISYLSELKTRKLMPALAATGIMMPILQTLRAEFFYVPLLIGAIGLASLNFSRGRGDSRFIMLLSTVLGAILVAVALFIFGDEIQRLLFMGQESYTASSLEDSRSGSLGSALIVNQTLLVRLALGIPYLFYFPIPFWSGLVDQSAIQLFKSLNALSFYFISAFVFVGAFRIAVVPQLRSPAFVFILFTPLLLSAVVAFTSLETRHFGAFLSFFFLVGLLPDSRIETEAKMIRLSFAVVVIGMAIIHGAWFALRYA